MKGGGEKMVLPETRSDLKTIRKQFDLFRLKGTVETSLFAFLISIVLGVNV